jgi:putative nucleotidyltransferase with HDIG domain
MPAGQEIPAPTDSSPSAAAPSRAAELLTAARAHERAGLLAEAVDAYEQAIATAERSQEPRLLVEALRSLSVVLHHRNESDRARALCQQSYQTSIELGESGLAAEALNTLGAISFEHGAMRDAEELFAEALRLGGGAPRLRSRIEQNLGILATVRGDHTSALGHYAASLEASQAAGDEKGCAIAYHNLGMISADREEWTTAEQYYRQSRAIAERIGDVHLQGLCLLNHSEVHIARQSYEQAREDAEAALAIFDRLGSRVDKSDAYRLIGMVYRETGRDTLAEARLRSAIDLAVSTGSLLSEAEASRELGRLYQGLGRNREALTLLNTSYRLFRRLDAALDLVDVQAKVADLEGTFLAVVRDWGQSIESADSYTFGHCGRVAEYAEAVGRAMGLGTSELTTLRLGAYLHDLGKVRVPHEILNKPGKLTAEEFDLVKQHPVWGIELLAGIEFPWDLKPIIRWHHERHDGTGYPDGLAGDDIPLAAQIICIVDVYDALTTTRSYRPAMSAEEALTRMRETASWWRSDVFAAFVASVGAPAGSRAT